MGFQDVDLLSRAATRSIADQPYPRLFFEHGLQWSIESRVVGSDAGYKIVLSLIDARTGLVADMKSVSVTHASEMEDAVAEFLRDAAIVREAHR